jgi:DNA adenine methylase
VPPLRHDQFPEAIEPLPPSAMSASDRRLLVTLRPLTGYIGGKWHLRKVICPIIDADNHTCYVEPFMGMANVFLGRARHRRVEVLNDANDDVVNLFRLVQRHPLALIEEIRFALASRTEYSKLFRTDPTGLTDIQRAARFLYLRRHTFSGKDAYAAGFSASKATAKVFDAREVRRRIEALHDRLDRTVIECLDFAEVIDRYDGSQTYFYFDPPYWMRTHLYKGGSFRQEDFARLASRLKTVRGRWLLSINDEPEVRALFAWATVEEVQTPYHAAVKKRPILTTELLIRPKRRGRSAPT